MSVPSSLKSEHEQLQTFAAAAHIGADWHEPDGVSAEVIGTRLDNACGADIRASSITHGYQEMVVVLHLGGGGSHCINLASLLALAAR